MGKISTLIVLINKKNACDNTEVVDINHFIEESDTFLNDFFRHADVKVPDRLVKSTLAKCING